MWVKFLFHTVQHQFFKSHAVIYLNFILSIIAYKGNNTSEYIE